MKLQAARLFSYLAFLQIHASSQHAARADDTGYFIQFTDLHVNVNYTVYNDATKLCVLPSNQSDPTIGQYGDYRCDPPMALIESAISNARIVAPTPDFILWTGDNNAHMPENTKSNTQIALAVIKNITEVLLQTYSGTPIYPVIGNHDQQPPNTISALPSIEFYAQLMNISGWERLLNGTANSTFRKGGYYSREISPKLKMIGMNSFLWCSCNHDPSIDTTEDPAEEFKWLQDELDEAKKSGAKVLIVSHIPIGYYERLNNYAMLHDRFNRRLINELKPFSDIIVGQLWGHAHTDTFRLFKDDSGKAILFGLIAPSLTPNGPEHFPSFRQYMYSRTTGTILEYKQYQLNLTAANMDGKPAWNLIYSSSTTYGLTSLTVESLSGLLDDFRPEKSAKFATYLNYNQYGARALVCSIPDDCKRSNLCAIEYPLSADYEKCIAGAGAAINLMNPLVLLPCLLWSIRRCF